MKYLLFLAACISFYACSAQQNVKQRTGEYFGPGLNTRDVAIAKDLHERVSGLAKKDSFSGVVLLAVKDKIIYEGAFGQASKEFEVPINFDTRFDLASMTKMLTGVAVAQLEQQRKIKFTDPVAKYLPELPSNLTTGITIHQLLTHTSGLGSYWTTEFHESNHARFRTLKDYLKLIENDTAVFQPGARWGYSNSGYLVLGLLIEKISGKTYFEFVKENVFAKAGMTQSDFLERDLVNKNVANSYTKQNRYVNGSAYTNTHHLGPVKGTSAGGAYSTAEDLLKFSTALQNAVLLNRQNTDVVMEGKAAYDRPERKKKYAYGFAEQFVNNQRIVFHDGAANGISTQMDMYPALGYTVIVLSNYDAPSAMVIAGYLREVLTK